MRISDWTSAVCSCELMAAGQFAEELVGGSRNAVIGKAHRLGLQSRPSPVRAVEGRKNAASKRPVAKKPVAEAEKPSAVPAAMPKPTTVAASAAAPREIGRAHV